MPKRPLLATSALLLALAACQDDPAPTALPTSSAAPAPPPPSAAAPAATTSAAPAAEPTAAAPTASAAAPAPAPATATASAAASPRPTATASAAAPPATASAAAPPATASAAEPAPSAAPAPGSADAVAVAIDQVFLDKKTFFAKFKQEHTQKVAGTTKKSTGVFYFERPNKISFRYDAPSKNRIVSDGTTLKVYIGEDNQMFVQPVDKTEYPGALAFLMGKGLGPSFNFAFHDKSKFEGGPVLLGKPRQATPHYDSVYFYVDKAFLEKKDPGVIRRVMLVDAQGNRNRFDFEGSTQPATIDPAEFTFTPPPGTNVTQN
ncbi:LolA family protein [Polyangium jinanense]|uniref:Outer membrane lipoprotein carrier protein LolA n=1 Tax=Polyangium jinanense TaxID=2829994 RepID=A0A9X3X5C5_9BACT|nr:outer membrane lipoprotein carrier protein LolA [Polyangium jinanense]MDC3959048.1 outer membrane lipoprotein carrier protein LolA [Polyangium jinanense]MDC3984029.1 outer membrane lipoprotein carrier protein LolA [Polyangium jinanense]